MERGGRLEALPLTEITLLTLIAAEQDTVSFRAVENDHIAGESHIFSLESQAVLDGFKKRTGG